MAEALISPDITDEIAEYDVVIYSIVPGISAENIEILSVDEREAAARKLKLSDRVAFIAGRILLRRLFARILSCDPRHIPVALTDKGQPEIEGCGFSFSISHAGVLSLIAVAKNRRLGIDLERLDRKLDTRLLAESYLPNDRRAAVLDAPEEDRAACFLSHWTAVEALAKATGRGLVFPADKTMLDAEGLSVRKIDSIPDYAIAVAADGADWQVRWGRTEMDGLARAS